MSQPSSSPEKSTRVEELKETVDRLERRLQLATLHLKNVVEENARLQGQLEQSKSSVNSEDHVTDAQNSGHHGLLRRPKVENGTQTDAATQGRESALEYSPKNDSTGIQSSATTGWLPFAGQNGGSPLNSGDETSLNHQNDVMETSDRQNRKSGDLQKARAENQNLSSSRTGESTRRKGDESPVVPTLQLERKEVQTEAQPDGIRSTGTVVEKRTSESQFVQTETISRSINSRQTQTNDTEMGSGRLLAKETMGKDKGEEENVEAQAKRTSLDYEHALSELISTARSSYQPYLSPSELSDSFPDITGQEPMSMRPLFLKLLEPPITRISELEEKLKSCQKELEEVLDDKKHLQDEYDWLLDKLVSLKTTMTERLDAQKQVDKLAQDLKDLESDRSRLKSENVAMSATIDELKKDAIKANGERHLLASKVEEVRSAFQMRYAGQIAGKEYHAQAEIQKLSEEVESYVQSMRNLQAALEEVESAREHDISLATMNLQSQLSRAKQEMEDVRSLLKTRESGLIQTLGEKDSYIGDLQNTAQETRNTSVNLQAKVYQQEETIQKLSEQVQLLSRQGDLGLDRELVVNLVVQFCSLMYSDPKRFEVLRLLAEILKLTEEQRWQVGLQRRPAGEGDPKSGEGVFQESLTDRWISYLLSSAGGQAPGADSPGPVNPTASERSHG